MYFFIINWNLVYLRYILIYISVYKFSNTIKNCVDLKKIMIFKIIFTWWNKQTLGTYLKTLFFGIYVGKDEFGNKYYKSKKDERWVIYNSNVEATKITSEWYLWMHYTTNILPNEKDKKYLWQKNHSENKTGTKESYKPIKIKKDINLKKYETWK